MIDIDFSREGVRDEDVGVLEHADGKETAHCVAVGGFVHVGGEVECVEEGAGSGGDRGLDYGGEFGLWDGRDEPVHDYGFDVRVADDDFFAAGGGLG